MLFGLGDASPEIVQAIDGLLLRAPQPSSTVVETFLRTFPEGLERNSAAQALIARGVDANIIASALTGLQTESWWSANKTTVWGVLATVSMALSVYHGYRRNNSIGWAIFWGLGATLLPVVTPVIAVAQGFGKRKAA